MDEGYLLSKNNFSENSIIIEAFTLEHGKSIGIVYGGSSKKQKKNFQICNKISLNWKSKGENKMGYFNIELINPISPLYFNNKKKSICILAAASLLKILLPEGQINKKIYYSFEDLLSKLNSDNWIKFYILWELSLIKELGFENALINVNNTSKEANNLIEINNKTIKVPDLLLKNEEKTYTNFAIKEALIFNKSLLMENFIIPNKLGFPLSRNILEKYYNKN